MKKIFLFLLAATFAFVNVFSQTEVVEPRSQTEKEDPQNMYNSENISALDLVEALDFAGIGIHKFDLGRFDKNYGLKIYADKYVDGELVDSVILLSSGTKYHYFAEGNDEPLYDYIDQIKILTKTDDNQSKLNIKTYAMGIVRDIEIAKTEDSQFFKWRKYASTKWSLSKKIPLMVFASSWLDKEGGFHRFCGVVELNVDDEETKELLQSSPAYIIINYKVQELSQ